MPRGSRVLGRSSLTSCPHSPSPLSSRPVPFVLHPSAQQNADIASRCCALIFPFMNTHLLSLQFGKVKGKKEEGGGGGAPRAEVPPTLHGCMPLRGDFDVEWDNDAELLLADMEFNEVGCCGGNRCGEVRGRGLQVAAVWSVVVQVG